MSRAEAPIITKDTYNTLWNFQAIELRTDNLIQDILVNFP